MAKTTYYKITNRTETHHGFKYETGLNIDTVPFREIGSCCAGGLYFTTINHIHKFSHYGCYLREVYLPTSNKEFRMVSNGSKFRANMIILDTRYDLSDALTLSDLRKNGFSNQNLLNKMAFQYGHLYIKNLHLDICCVLDFSFTKITDEDVKFLGECYILDLSGTNITDCGAQFLGGCHTLDLSGTKITDHGVQFLGKCCELDLSYTCITDKSIKFLSTCRKLNLLYTRITYSGVEWLRSQGCHVLK